MSNEILSRKPLESTTELNFYWRRPGEMREFDVKYDVKYSTIYMQWLHVKNFDVRKQYIDFMKTIVLFYIISKSIVSQSDV